jgi:hypothetical protein
METKDTLTPDLLSWAKVQNEIDWSSGILIGNGASIAVSKKFLYKSIFTQAKSQKKDPLNEKDVSLFNSMESHNFEKILSYLAIAKIVNEALGINKEEIEDRYHAIQNALIEAVHNIHIPHYKIGTEKLKVIRDELENYKYIYSLNYDLLIYWAIMAFKEGSGFKDYFWSSVFDISDVEIRGKATCVLYLHGSLLHYRLPSGETKKRKNRDGTDLLTSFGLDTSGYEVPLFVTEGTASDKLSSIYRSDYLSFALSTFSEHEDPLVIFGCSLGENDKHLINAINNWQSRKLAIAIFRQTDEDVIKQKAHYFQLFKNPDITFFDATTHPLGFKTINCDDLKESE